jgi:hypothetical protein
MHRKIILRFALISVCTAIVISCAKISSPSGGRRDKLPPVVVNSVPANGARNFNGKKIEIEFNEYVALDNITDKFMLSPPMKKQPRVQTRGKSVMVEFDEKLKDSTTYTLYFQDAIKDLNEGNILKNYQFRFSTGSVIDTLSATGNVYNANNLEAPEKTIAVMYKELADSAVIKHLPQYITRVDATGYFRIDNVRPGKYRIYSVKDGDNSKNYNLPDEEFAFMDSTIVISSEKNYIPPPKIVVDTTITKKVVSKTAKTPKDTTNAKKAPPKIEDLPPLDGEFKLYQFLGPKKTHYMTSSKRELKYLLVYTLSLPPDSMRFDFSIPGTDPKSYFTETNKNRDTMKVWLTDSTLYSKQSIRTLLKYPFTDTLGITGYKPDTISMSIPTPRVSKSASAKKVKRTVLTLENNISTGQLKPGQTIAFKSKTPLKEPDTTHIRLFETVQTTQHRIPYRFIRDSTISTRFFLKAKLDGKNKYFFLADKGSFTNIFNEYTDSIGIKFAIKDPEKYCKITMDVVNYTGNRIIQLLDKSEKLMAETYMTKDGTVVFSLLDPGFYRLKVIYDLNGDRKWTTGDFKEHRQPEPVSYYPIEIELRDGYELTFSGEKAWDIGTKNVKDYKLRAKPKGK